VDKWIQKSERRSIYLSAVALAALSGVYLLPGVLELRRRQLPLCARISGRQRMQLTSGSGRESDLLLARSHSFAGHFWRP